MAKKNNATVEEQTRQLLEEYLHSGNNKQSVVQDEIKSFRSAIVESESRLYRKAEEKYAEKAIDKSTRNLYKERFDKVVEDASKQIAKAIREFDEMHRSLSSIIQYNEETLKAQKALLSTLQRGTEEYDTQLSKVRTTENNLRVERESLRDARFSNAPFLLKADEYKQRKSEREEQIRAAKITRDSELNSGDPAKMAQAEDKYQTELKRINQEYGNATGDLGVALLSGLFNSMSGNSASGISAVMKSTLGGVLGSALGPISATLTGLYSVVKSINKLVSQGVSKEANLATEYLSKIDARLQGTADNITYNTLRNWMDTNFYGNPFISQTKLMQNIASLTEKGIAYNLEQRALIETMKDKMVATFDVLEGSLPRLIRLQQADITKQQLGAEAELTKMLNRVFQDTSYLDSMYDNISSAIIEGTSQMNFEQSVAYQYAVQKWLAAMHAVGLSEAAEQTIAQGLTYLTTGNVTEFTNNSSITTLFGLAASNAGMSISDILVNGLDASGVNELMKSMVTYLQQIVNNTSGNQVVKSAWGNITNLNLSDFRAIQNLSDSDIAAVYDYGMTYIEATKEFDRQLTAVNERISTPEKIENLIDSFLLDLGQEVVADEKRYIRYRIGQAIGGVFGTALSFWESAKQAWDVAGRTVELLGESGGSISSYLDERGLYTIADALSSMMYVNERGSSYTGLTGAVSGVSYSGGVNIPSAGETFTEAFGIEQPVNVMQQAAEAIASSAETVTGTTTTKELSDLYDQLFELREKPIRVQLVSLESQAQQDLSVGDVAAIKGLLTDGEIPVVIVGNNTSSFDVNNYVNTISSVRA